jgi:Secretion system C-terminal sorting domain
MKVISPHRLLLVLFCCINCIVVQTPVFSQTVQRQMVSAQGGVYTSNGLVFSQSIGQLSVIGTSTTPRFTFQQGFQQSLTAMVSNTISVPEFAVTIFPNPVVDSFTITVANAPEESLNIKITNLLGQVLYQGQLPSFQSQKTIPFGSFPNGTYLVQLFSAHQIVTKKIIKI